MFTININVNVAGFDRLIHLGERIMTTVTQIQAKLDALSDAAAAERAEVLAALQGFRDQIKALQDQIAAGGVATQADLDAIGTTLDTAIAKVQGIIDASDTA